MKIIVNDARKKGKINIEKNLMNKMKIWKNEKQVLNFITGTTTTAVEGCQWSAQNSKLNSTSTHRHGN